MFGKSLVNKESSPDIMNIRNSNWSFRDSKSNGLVE
jgi:hypothetical protein